jgi:hypothetical protein
MKEQNNGEVAQWGDSYFILIPKYHYADQVKENEVGGHVARTEEERKFNKVWVGKP